MRDVLSFVEGGFRLAALLEHRPEDEEAHGESGEEPFEDLDDLGIAAVRQRDRTVDCARDRDRRHDEAAGDRGWRKRSVAQTRTGKIRCG